MRDEDLLRVSTTQTEDLQMATQALKTSIRDAEIAINNFDQLVASLERKRSQEAGGKLNDLEAFTNDLSKTLVKANSEREHVADSLAAEHKAHDQQLASIAETKELIVRKEAELRDARAACTSMEREHSEVVSRFQQLQSRQHGFTVSQGQGGTVRTITDELVDAKKQAEETAARYKQTILQKQMAEADLKKLETSLRKSDKEWSTLQEQQRALEDAIRAASTTKPGAKQSAPKHSEPQLLSSIKQLQQQRSSARDQLEQMSARLAAFEFSFSDPHPGFDRTRVKGLVAQLINLKDTKTATALEVVAGGKLFNVIVDTEETGKALLQNGRLKRRVTIIPLNRISARAIDEATVQRARAKVGAENVHSALSLVGYDDELDAAMQFVFGSALVCRDLNRAKDLTFDASIAVRTVTLDGDTFDPSGTLTGGSAPSQSPVLNDLQAVREQRETLAALEAQLSAAEEELRMVREQADAGKQLELKKRELELLLERMAGSQHHQDMEQLNKLRTQIDDCEREAKSLREHEVRLKERCQRLESDAKEGRSASDREKKALETELAAAKKALAASQSKLDSVKSTAESLELEVAQLKTELTALDQQLVALKASVHELEKKSKAATSAFQEKQQEYERAASELKQMRLKLSATDNEIAAAVQKREAARQSKADAELELKKNEHKREKLLKEKKEAGRSIEVMLEKHPWIQQEKVHFGKANTDYDFSHKDVGECEKRMEKLRETQGRLSKTVNMKVMSMFGKAEQEYNDLLKKKKTVETDKTKIEQAIDELAAKKNEALQRIITQVNRDFGSIFSTLLPGARAELSPPAGGTILDGLEIRIGFGDVWCESLDPLSGGQRSLVALSLILALLLFKPAPMYILDEVDAALDLSHTQNIGHMLRTHFRNSQFIIVSLKDGMFSNANVLFRTKFVDGVSTVTRHALDSRAIAAAAAAAGGAAAAGAAGAAAAGAGAAAKGTSQTKKARKVLGEL
jgi:structural maintenance of chromosome 2